MTWTYGGDPTANDRDEVRFLCGDTDTSDQLASDEEVAYAIAESTSDNKIAAALICEALAAKYARYVDFTNGPASERASQRAAHFEAKALQLRKQATSNARPFFGGQSIADKQDLNADSDVPQPYFYRGRLDIDGGPSSLNGGSNDEGTS